MDQAHTISPPAGTHDMVSSSAMEKGSSTIMRKTLAARQNQENERIFLLLGLEVLEDHELD
jgi:hypothetical protein